MKTAKRIAIAAAALAVAAPLATTAASADPYQNRGGYSDHRDNNRYDRGHDNRNYDNRNYDGRNYDGRNYDGRNYNNRGYNNGWNNQYQGQRHWRRGDRLSAYDQGRFRSFDYRRDHYREPPRGYRYVRDDSGDVLLVGVLSGVILSAILNN